MRSDNLAEVGRVQVEPLPLVEIGHPLPVALVGRQQPRICSPVEPRTEAALVAVGADKCG